ncbi:MAG: hypothetical protein M1118_14615 [Chloroflexi bacterium]|nr:hypothetical protein [Chloroflexota bacterium]
MCVQSKYYPISANNQWVYQITGLPGSTTRQTTQTVTNVTPTTFTMQLQSPPGALIDIKWLCTPNGLTSATLNTGIGGPSTPQTMAMTFTKETGVWIPPDAGWAVGKKWTVSYDVTTTMTATTSVKSTGTITVDFTIASQGPITVPAGTFNNAFKVHEVITENLTMNFNGKSIPLKTVGNVDAWFAANAGQVKSVTTTAGGSPINEVLMSYHVQ